MPLLPQIWLCHQQNEIEVEGEGESWYFMKKIKKRQNQRHKTHETYLAALLMLLMSSSLEVTMLEDYDVRTTTKCKYNSLFFSLAINKFGRFDDFFGSRSSSGTAKR